MRKQWILILSVFFSVTGFAIARVRPCERVIALFGEEKPEEALVELAYAVSMAYLTPEELIPVGVAAYFSPLHDDSTRWASFAEILGSDGLREVMQSASYQKLVINTLKGSSAVYVDRADYLSESIPDYFTRRAFLCTRNGSRALVYSILGKHDLLPTEITWMLIDRSVHMTKAQIRAALDGVTRDETFVKLTAHLDDLYRRLFAKNMRLYRDFAHDPALAALIVGGYFTHDEELAEWARRDLRVSVRKQLLAPLEELDAYLTASFKSPDTKNLLEDLMIAFGVIESSKG